MKIGDIEIIKIFIGEIEITQVFIGEINIPLNEE
jgi:hypothetical protein